MMKTAREFCKKHAIDKDVRNWLYRQHPLKSKAPMSEIYPILKDSPEGDLLLLTATSDGVLSDSDKLDLARWCAFQVVDFWEWKASDVVKSYLKYGGELVRKAAMDDAWNHDVASTCTDDFAWASAWAAIDIQYCSATVVARTAANCAVKFIRKYALLADLSAFRKALNKKILSYGNPFKGEKE
jgi:hypothetical protein